MLQNGTSLVDHPIVAPHSTYPTLYPSHCTDSTNNGSFIMNGTATTHSSSSSSGSSTANNNNNHKQTSTNGTNTHTSNGLSSSLCGNTLSSLLSALATTGGFSPPNIKDSRWLTLEVCRQFQRNQCSRDEKECKFAHPPTHVDVQNGRVICCYDSIKGKCQRRDPPCKYLHPPQHLREQLMQNGRNNMILRNMQLQFFQQQLLAQQTGVVSFQTAVATVGGCSSQASGISNGGTGPTSLLYPGAGTLGMNNRTISNNYPLLNFGYAPFLNALPGSCPDYLLSEHPNDCSKRSVLIDPKTCLPNYYPGSNGVSQNNGTPSSKLECAESPNIVVAGGAIDSQGMTEMNGGSTQSVNICSTIEAATAAATLYALRCSQSAALLNLHAPPPPSHPTGPPVHHPLTARSLVTCTVGGPTMAPTPFHALSTHAGFYQPTYHIEIPPYPYQ